MTKFRFLTVLLLVGFVATGVLGAPDTFSIDAISPSPNDPADLLNLGMSVQVPGVNLGLVVGDELDALSSGDDAVQLNNIVFFSVDRTSIGNPGPFTLASYDVLGQSALNQQAGDMFVTTNAGGMGVVPQGINMLYNDDSFYGELPGNLFFQNNAGNLQDNLDAISFDEFDWNGDTITDQATFFSLGAGSASLGGGFSAADILISLAGSGSFGRFAPAFQMGLQTDDDLDALALLDMDQNGAPTLGDMALFSLAPGSPTLAAIGASAADVFLTTFNGNNAVWYSAASLGLLPGDNVDALEVQIPEPATLGLLGLGLVMFVTNTYRRRRGLAGKRKANI